MVKDRTIINWNDRLHCQRLHNFSPIPTVTWTGLQPNDTRVSVLASGTELRIANVTQDDDQGTGLIITCTGANTYRPSGLTYQFKLSVQGK